MLGTAIALMMAHVMAEPLAVAARPEIELIGTAEVPAEARDRSGLTELLAGEFAHDLLGSFGSAIEYTGSGDLYVACSDRGPLDGATRWRPRMQTLRIAVNPGSATPVEVSCEGTALLTNESGEALTGFYGRFDEADRSKDLRYDPEGVRCAGDGTYWIAEEYGPSVDRFSADGKRVERVVIPEKFVVETRSADPLVEMPPMSTRGRQANRGFEGLATSPDGTTLWAILQSPLIQDGALNEKAKRAGLNVRILEMVVAGEGKGTTRELVYQLEKGSNGVSEVLAINGHELLVLERDGEVAREAVWRRVYRVDIAEATDVSGVGSLPMEELPPEIVAVKKTKWLDLVDEKFGLVGKGMPEKIEGLAFGPRLEDGRRTLVVTVDNDLRADVASTVWVFGWRE